MTMVRLEPAALRSLDKHSTTEPLCSPFNPLKPGNTEMGAMANSEDLHEILHNTAFHLGLHCLIAQKQSADKEMQYFLEIIKYPFDHTYGLGYDDLI